MPGGRFGVDPLLNGLEMLIPGGRLGTGDMEIPGGNLDKDFLHCTYSGMRRMMQSKI